MGWNRIRKSTARFGIISSLAGSAVIGYGGPARAQGVYAIIENGIVRAALGESGQDNSQNATGRFYVQDITGGTAKTIMYGPTVDRVGVSGSVNVPGSFLTLRIDAGAQPAGQVVDPNWKGWDLIVGEATGTWLLPPTVINNRIIARWATARGSSTTNPVPPIQVNIDISLVHDMASYRFTVFNGIKDTVPPTPGTGPHRVGLRFAQNYSPNEVPGPGQPSNQGPIFISTGQRICTETLLSANQVGDSWRLFDKNFQNTAGATIRPVGFAQPFILPDALQFGAATIMSELWDHAPVAIPGFNFCDSPWDAAAALFWNPRNIPTADPNGTVFGTYFGRQFTTINYDRTWSTGVEGPLSLKLDPSAPPGSQLTPSQFKITAFALNQNAIALNSVNAVLSLPDGLKLAPGETAAKTATNIGPSAEAGFSWNVAPTGTRSGILGYSVSFSANPGGLGSTASRTIEVPALPTQQFTTGLQMISFPYGFDDPTPAVVLGLQTFQFDLVRWNPNVGRYEAVQTIQPGQGYWLNLATGATLNLTGGHPVTVPGGQFEIKLLPDWNQIGNPFLFGVRWSDVQVLNTTAGELDANTPLSVEQASDLQHQWILPTIYRYDTNDAQYHFDSDFFTELQPFQGYWVRALKPNISLLIPQPVGRASRISRSAKQAPAAGPNNWKLRLVATANGKSDSYNFLGIGTGASDGYDLRDVQKPPSIQGRITLGFVRNDWGGRKAGVYAQDIQAANGGRKTWDLAVTSPEPNTDVTISWPEIGALPRTYELYVTDKATGQRRAMRQTSSLRINTGESATRALTVMAEPRTAGVFRITGVQVVPTRGNTSAQIQFTSTQDANIQVRVLKSTGEPLTTLVTRAASSGTTQTLWNYRDARGVSVAAGVYQIEVKGTTADGSQARVVVPYVVTR